ncbi:hypothetical protein Ddye_015825 [Dipteronia dyeriana]|uniref:Uncharacterized protein n=1 Tax=Dipteronia dyeriana TaxID=168575 RepID=A0AAD9U6B0_9ROSI|nr:hypothetical protein Ddye_015825 [Dipteronia dyeriana]
MAASGQVVNFSESALYVSQSVTQKVGARLAKIVGVGLVRCHERYLGLPSFAGINKRQLFNQIKDWIWQRLQGWQNHLFFSGGKEILLKAVDLGGSWSYVWRSFLWGCDLLVAGSRWIVVARSSLSIYHDQWIPFPFSFKIQYPLVLGSNALVRSLFTSSGRWNEQLILSSFLADKADEIISLPLGLSQDEDEDSLLWHFEKSCAYSVKSGYRFGRMLLFRDPHSGSKSIDWWKLL